MNKKIKEYAEKLEKCKSECVKILKELQKTI